MLYNNGVNFRTGAWFLIRVDTLYVSKTCDNISAVFVTATSHHKKPERELYNHITAFSITKKQQTKAAKKKFFFKKFGSQELEHDP